MSVALLFLTAILCSPGPSAAQAPDQPGYEPLSAYSEKIVQGWKVLLNHRLLEDEKELGDRVIELLSVKLYEINRVVPAGALAKLHEIPIWLEFQDPGFACACYHPNRQWLADNGYNPQKAGSVEIANAATFLEWIDTQPAMVLHELAHGYHHLYLGGYDNPQIADLYRRAVESKSYESVLHRSGRRERAYALNNSQEYFAELSEAWFGTNDFYPFVRAEVVEHDPAMAELLDKLWEK